MLEGTSSNRKLGISELKWSWFQKSRYLKDLDTMDTASRGPWGSFLLLLGMKP